MALELRIGDRAAQLVPHMGVLSGRHPRNSLEAVRECLEAGAARIELDIHSLDGPDYIVYHDRRLEDETTGAGSLGVVSPDAVRATRFRAHPETRPPLLSEVIEAVAPTGAELQLDWKDLRFITRERAATLASLVAPMRDRVIVSTGQDWNLRRLQEFEPAVPFGFDPGLYLDHRIEGTDIIMPRSMGAYGYRDDHPLALARGQEVRDYLHERMSALMLQAPGARECFLSFRMVLQMLDDGFDATAWLHERGIGVNVWTVDYGRGADEATARRLLDAGVDRITTNTAAAWLKALAPVG